MPVPAVLSPPSLSSVQRWAWRAEHYISQAVTAHPPAPLPPLSPTRLEAGDTERTVLTTPSLPSPSSPPFLPPPGLLEPKTVEISEQPRTAEAKGWTRPYLPQSCLHVVHLPSGRAGS
ncbi:hypothetical protein ILYODFUR_004155 [Ilyodon furcidens]|uniref:Uncharacterized protein n=1 Tax=Ilyodon furcidens TaxID=33524 RepID=A0ABV0UD67_9TELE